MTTISPCHVHAHVGLLHAEVELIRQELGRPRDDRARYAMTGAVPREVYAVARTLFDRADRLAAEHTGERAATPAGTAINAIEPANVFGVVDAALGSLLRVKARLGIDTKATAPEVDPARQPSDCLDAILLVNRQLDRLLARPVTPGDVDEQLAVAESHALAVLVVAGVAAPAMPALERKKRPGDVLTRIITMLRALRPVVTASSGTMLDVKDSPIAIDDVLPSDCYDLASLAANELIYLHGMRRGPLAAGHRIDTVPRLPSHCYQRASRLEAVVTALGRAKT